MELGMLNSLILNGMTHDERQLQKLFIWKIVESGMRLFKGLCYFCGCMTVPQMQMS